MINSFKIVLFYKILAVFTLVGIANSTYSQCNSDAGSNVSTCANQPVQLNGSGTINGGGAPTFSWTPITGLSNPNIANPIATISTTTTYTLTVTGNGCNVTDQVTITVNPNPTASFTFTPNNQCANLPVVFTNTSTGSGLSYSWNFNNPASGSSNTSTQTNPSHEFISVGNGTETFAVNLIVTNSNGCTASATQNVTVNQTPGPGLIDPISEFKNCDGSGSFTMTAFNTTTSSAVSNYIIQWGDGTPNFNNANFPGGGVTHTYTTQNIFNLLFIVTGNNGCIDTAITTVGNITNPAIGAANPGGTTGCGPLTLCFPLSNFATNHISTYYVVNYGDGTPSDTLNHPPPAVLCHTYSESSCGGPGNSFTFRMKAINLCDSSEATISPIRVYTGPIASFTATPVPGCVGSPITMMNASTLGFNSTCATTTIFNWDFGDGTTLTQFALSNPTHIYTAPGTYTVTLSTQNACGTTTDTKVVCIEPAPVPLFTISPQIACVPFNATTVNQTTTTNTCNVTYNWTVLFNGSTCLPSSGTFNFIGGTNASSFQPQFQFVDPGTYTVRLTVTNSCGSFIYDQIVTARAKPIVSLTPVGPICAGQSVTPAATINDCYDIPTTFNWTFTGSGAPNSNLQNPGSITYNSAGNFNITFAATNICGITNASTPIEVNAAPPLVNPTVNSPICVGGAAQFNATLVAGASYNWSGPNGFTSTLQNPLIDPVTAASSGTYSVSANNNGCPGPVSTVDLVIINPPVVTVTPASASICENQTVTLTADGATTYSWSPATNLNVTNQAVVIASPSTTTTYTVTGSVGSCSSNTTITVTVNTLPITNAGNDITLCNQPITETLVGTPAGGTWSGVGILANGNFTPTTTGTFVATYTFVDGNSCQSSDNVTITVVNPVAVTVDPDFEICLNQPNVNLVGNPVGGTWSGTNVTAAGVFSPSTVGTFTLTYALGGGSCQTTDDIDITVKPLPIVNAGTNQSICIDNGIINLIGTPAGGTWSGTSVTAGGAFNPTTAGVGSFVLTYTYVDPITNCENISTKTITVNALPSVNAGVDLTVCNQPIPVTLSGTPVGGTWSGTGITNPSGQFTPSGTGLFLVTYTFTDANGCTNQDDVEITVVDPTDANAGNDLAVCIDASNVQLNGLPAGGTWSGSGITSSGVYTPSAVGNFIMTYTFGTGTCLTTDNVMITVNPLPNVNAGNNFDVCIDAPTTTLNGTPVGGTWSGTGITNPTGQFNPATAGLGTHTATYTFTNANGCTNTDALNVTVNGLPVVNAGIDTTLCNQPFPIQFTGTPVGGVWSGTNITAGGIFTPSGVGNFTITYTFTLGTGCEASDDRIVTVVDPVQANAGLDQEICINEPNVQLNGTPAGGTWSGTNVTAGGLFSPITAGTFTLTYSFGAGNCLTTDAMNFIVHALPIVNAGADADFCLTDAAVNFVGAPLGGVWSGTGITNATLGTFNPTNAGVAVHTITYTYTDANSCVNTDILEADVHPLPSVSFNNNPIACIGASETFTNTTLLGNTYNWSFGDGSSSTATSPSHTYSSIGFYDIDLITTTIFGCIDSVSGTIEVREPPVAFFTLAPDSGCAPLIVNFTDNSSGVAISYAWDFGNGQTNATSTPPAITYTQGVIADTTYYIQLNVTNFCGTVSHVDSVIAMPSPTAVFGPLFDIGCSPWPLEFANNSLGLPDTYSWDFGDGTTSTNGDPLFIHTFTTGANPTDYTIMLAVANECGVDTAYHTITVLPNTVNAFFNTNVTNGCVPLTVNFTQFSTGAPFYSWNFGDGNTSTIQSPTHTFTTPGTYTVALYINDGCSYDTSYATITVNPSPTVNFTSSPATVCINHPFTFTNLSQGLASSTWDFGDGGSSLLTNPSHSYSVSGTYQVTLTGVSLTNGCVATVTHPVTVSVNPTAGFTATPMAGCMPLPVSFTNTSTNYSFQSWNFGDGNTSGANNPNHTFTNAGSYTVKLVVENANGCRDSISQVIMVYPLPNAAFTIANTDACYAPVNMTTANNSTGAVNYEWNFGNGFTSLLTNPTTNYANPGTYTIQLIATTIHGCKDTATMPFTVYPTPEAAFTLPNDSACVGELLSFISQSNFADSIVWIFGDGTTGLGSTVTHAYMAVGTYTVTIMAYGAGGCGDTLTINTGIQVFPTPTAGFDWINLQNPDPLSGTVEFTNTSLGAISYEWQFGNGQSSDEENPTHRFRQIGSFFTTLYATNEFGCTDSITQEVIVEYFKGLHIPNAMYPGHNSFEVANFIPKGVGLKAFQIWVYDAWGNLMWYSDKIDADGRPTEYWDGTFEGKILPQDAYVWKVEAIFTDETSWQGKEYPNGMYRAAGTLTILR